MRFWLMLWLVEAKLLLHQQGLGDRQTETGLGGHAEVGRELCGFI
jgi:hypothetical protein